MKKAGLILILLFAAGGFIAVFQALGIWAQIFVGFFPMLAPAFKQALEDYLTSAYFVVGVITFVLSTVFGIALTIKEKKVLYAIVSIIVDLITLFSIISNLACCG